jgi:hypothetical protein
MISMLSDLISSKVRIRFKKSIHVIRVKRVFESAMARSLGLPAEKIKVKETRVCVELTRSYLGKSFARRPFDKKNAAGRDFAGDVRWRNAHTLGGSRSAGISIRV